MTNISNPPDIISLGNPRADFAYFIMMLLFFTGLGVFTFFFVTGRTKMRQEIKEAFGRDFLNLPKRNALAFIGLAWVVAVTWIYNSSLGTKFFELSRSGQGAQSEWLLVYHYPDRIRRIPANQVAGWTGAIQWEGRTLRHALVLKTASGREFVSAGLPPSLFADKAKLLEAWEIKIPGEITEDKSKPPPDSSGTR